MKSFENSGVVGWCVAQMLCHWYYHIIIVGTVLIKSAMVAYGLADRALDSRSKGLGFAFHCWSCVEVLGKLVIPYSLCLTSSDEYLDGQQKLNCNEVRVKDFVFPEPSYYRENNQNGVIMLILLCYYNSTGLCWLIWYIFDTFLIHFF